MLGCRKILISKEVGLAVFIILIIYIAMPNKQDKLGTHSISEKTSRRTTLYNVTTPFQTTTMVAGRIKMTLTSKRNHQKDTTTIKTTKTKTTTTATTKTRTPNKMTIKIFTITPSKNSSVGHRIPKTSTVHPKTTARPKHVICFRLMSRLGNLMFEYASAYGIARSKGMDVIISKDARIAKVFHLNRGGRVVKNTSMCKGIKTIFEVRASAFDKEIMNFSNNKNIALWGYLQSYKYFEKVSDEIRRQFTFRDSIKKVAEGDIRDILEEHQEKHNWTFVAVHVRRGDMVNHKKGYMVAPKEYFQRAQNMFRALYKHVLFVVCSDDIKWCKANLKSNDTYFVEGNSPEVDMAILSSCNHTISSVGSFSWWSAWLAKGMVTYYCPPARPGSRLRKTYSKDFNDYFPSTWIRVELEK